MIEILVTIILIVVLLGIGVLYGAASWGLVMYKFWYWFLLPVFPSLPHVTFAHAVGLAVFVGLFHTVQSQVIKKEYKDETQGMVLAIIAPWVTLVFGWLIHLVIA